MSDRQGSGSPRAGRAAANAQPQADPAANGDSPAAAPPTGATTDDATAELASRPRRYMVGVRTDLPNLAPQAASGLFRALELMPGVQVEERLDQPGLVTMALGDIGQNTSIAVVKATPDRAAYLEQAAAARPDMLVSRVQPLIPLDAGLGSPLGLPPVPQRVGPTVDIPITVQNAQGQPLAGAEVNLYSMQSATVTGTTNAQGIAVCRIGEAALGSLIALYVHPHADHWEKLVDSPALNPQGPNVVRLEPLGAYQPAGFPGEPNFLGWGQRLMGLDRNSMTGNGVRIAIIDSGCDTTHPALNHITQGIDLLNGGDTGTWRQDGVGHGTHCAGVIAGNGTNGHIRGFCPGAEIHVIRIFPGGETTDIVRALNYCVNNNIDVANLSFGGPGMDANVAQVIGYARQAGLALCVAAGNSGGPVMFPASAGGVLAVSAVGRDGEFPANTYHARTRPAGNAPVNGIFPPVFTCHGPQVAVCGPGVAIISSVPGGGYAAWDGTSMATPHLSGLCGLALAHHPALQGMPRGAARVDRLFQLLAQSVTQVGLNPQWVGAGLPTLPALAARSVAPAPAATAPDYDAMIQAMVANTMRTMLAGQAGVQPQNLGGPGAMPPGFPAPHANDGGLLPLQRFFGLR